MNLCLKILTKIFAQSFQAKVSNNKNQQTNLPTNATRHKEIPTNLINRAMI